MADLESSFRALTQVHPRSMQVLLARLVAAGSTGPGRTRAELATHYGISEAAAQVLLFRAVRDFEATLGGTAVPGPIADDAEREAAAKLDGALSGEAPLPIVEHLRVLTSHAQTVQERLARAEQAELASPEYARETWLRRVAIVVVIAVSIWFGRAEVEQWLERVASWWATR